MRKPFLGRWLAGLQKDDSQDQKAAKRGEEGKEVSPQEEREGGRKGGLAKNSGKKEKKAAD